MQSRSGTFVLVAVGLLGCSQSNSTTACIGIDGAQLSPNATGGNSDAPLASGETSGSGGPADLGSLGGNSDAPLASGGTSGSGGATETPDLGSLVKPPEPTPTSFGGVTFPWKIFDGTVPDVPTAVAPGRTFYCDPVGGDDTWDGSSMTHVSGKQGPKKTLSAAMQDPTPKVGVGDTILLKGGIYRERFLFGGVAGKAGSPMTIGSYGRGTGAPIIDGGLKPNPWTKYTASGATTVWQMSTVGLSKITESMPVLGVYVNTGTMEAALREVSHGQLTLYGKDPMPPLQTQANLTDGSNNWYYDTAGKMLYADFGKTLGTGDPNGADISILYNSEHGPAGHELVFSLQPENNYISFIGLTIRAGSWSAIFSLSSGITVDRCDIKFNGGSGILFGANEKDITVTNNSLLYSRIWMNVLANWPRFNNGYVSGSWPGGLSWFAQSNALAQGNVVYQNGGEGMIFWKTNANGSTVHESINNVARNNLVFDNYSINMYLDNTQNATIDQNFIFNHPLDPSQTFDNLLALASGYADDWGRRMQARNLSLADEPGSSFEAEGQAHLANITVTNNIIVGGPFGVLDYDDGTHTVFHGLKNCRLVNNTIVVAANVKKNWDTYGFRHLLWGGKPDASVNSIVQNNIIVVQTASTSFVATGVPGAGPGIDNDYNLYSGTGHWLSVEAIQDFPAWKVAHPTWDQHSLNVDAQLMDITEFNQTAAQKPVYDWSKAAPAAGSPALTGGVELTAPLATDFAGKARSTGSKVMGALAP